MNGGQESSPASSGAESDAGTVQARAEAYVDHSWGRLKKSAHAMWDSARFLFFFLYVLTAIVRFWLWAVTVVLILLRVALHFLAFPLRRAGGAYPPPRSPGTSLHQRGAWRAEFRSEVVTPLSRMLADGRDVSRSFWHFTFARKVLVVILSFAFVVVPGSYFVPRVHTVQVLDDNALNYQDSKIGQSTAGYIIHAMDVDEPGKTREYVNENAWWLGKVNSQGLKAKIVPGRFYRIWVVGLRWWWAPPLYPNIVSVTETDAKGQALHEPSVFMPATTTGK